MDPPKETVKKKRLPFENYRQKPCTCIWERRAVDLPGSSGGKGRNDGGGKRFGAFSLVGLVGPLKINGWKMYFLLK